MLNKNFKIQALENDHIVVSPYAWISMFDIKPGTIMYSPCFCYVVFEKLSHGFIYCLINKNTRVIFNSNGQLCMWDNVSRTYIYDDEAECMLWPDKNRKIWKVV